MRSTTKGEALRRLKEFLDGEDWCITGGLAVHVHVDGDRAVGDIDLLMRTGTAERLAERLGLEPEREKDHGDGFTGQEEIRLAFELKGEEVEVMAGRSSITIDGETYTAVMDDALFRNAVRAEAFGVEVPVVPVEDILIQRVVLGREKDMDDIEMLLASNDIDGTVLEESLDARSMSRERFEQLLEERGFSL